MDRLSRQQQCFVIKARHVSDLLVVFQFFVNVTLQRIEFTTYKRLRIEIDKRIVSLVYIGVHFHLVDARTFDARYRTVEPGRAC